MLFSRLRRIANITCGTHRQRTDWSRSDGSMSCAAARLVLDHVLGHHRRLGEGEDQGQRQKAKTLKFTQVSVDTDAPDDFVEDGDGAKRTMPQRMVSLRQPSSVMLDGLAHDELEKDLSEEQAAEQNGAEQALMSVTFTLMKVSSWSQRVRAPKTATKPALISGTTASLRVSDPGNGERDGGRRHEDAGRPRRCRPASWR